MRKIIGFFASVLFAASLSLGLIACGGEVEYEISVKTRGGAPVSAVQVQAYSGSTLLGTKTTDASGKAVFELDEGSYDIKVVNLPVGYQEIEGAEFKTKAGETKVDVFLDTAVIKDNPPAGKFYQVGDVLYDFEIETDILGKVTVSELLEEKKAVVLNFWATWCTYCVEEFPNMQEAYEMYQEDLEIIAISASDGMQAIRNWKASRGYTFPMAPDIGIQQMFVSSGIPFTVVVDRYGVIAYTHEGYGDLETFMSAFNKYTAEDYTQDVIIGGGDVNDDENEGTEILKPNVSQPESSEIESAINANGANITYLDRMPGEPEENYTYTWPWMISSDGESIYPAGKDMHSAVSLIFLNFQATKGQTLTFDYKLATEKDYDELYVQVSDGAAYSNTLIHKLSGTNDWTTLYAFPATRNTTYTISLLYMRDSDDHDDPTPTESTVLIKNVRITNESDINSPTSIKRYAVDGMNKTAGDEIYESYVTPVFNETDGYYHVGEENGPILYADMMYATPWSSSSIYSYVYYDLCVFEGFDYSELYNEYCWLATNSDNEYVPVNEELKFLLQLFVEMHGNGYENEWLETCLYYERYNITTPEVDPIKGVWFTSAIPITEGQTDVVIEKVLMPRGYKYVFIPTRSGAYEIKSTGDKDTVAWLFDENRNEILYNDEALASDSGRNFHFNYYMEAGKTYYVICAFWKVDEFGEYKLNVNFIAEEYDYFTNAGIAPYTYDDVTGEIFVPEAIEYAKDENGYYRELRANGTLGSYIYLDMINYTYLLSEQTLQSVIESAGEYEEEKRAFYFSKTLPDGTDASHDYTAQMQAYLDQALDQDIESELYGYVKVDEDLFEILKLFTQKYDGFGGVRNSWLLMCYYYQHLGA